MFYKHPSTPLWFDNKNYDGAEKLTAKEWYMLLSERWIIFDSFINELPNIDWQPDEDINDFHSIYMLNQYMKAPLVVIYPEDIPSKAEKNEIVCSPSFDDLSEHVKLAKMIGINEYNSANRYTQNSGEPFAFAAVDLSAPKDLIISSFKKWLEQELKKIKACSKDSFDKEIWSLISHRVLQYIDLMLYSKFVGKNYTYDEYAGIIFGFEASADKIRQTTKPKAEQCLSEVYCNWLKHFFQ